MIPCLSSQIVHMCVDRYMLVCTYSSISCPKSRTSKLYFKNDRNVSKGKKTLCKIQFYMKNWQLAKIWKANSWLNQERTQRDGDGSTWKWESCSLVNFVVKYRTTTALLSSCSFWTEATALFLPTSFSEKMKLPDKSHNSTVPSSCKVTDLTPARMRFFATGSKDNIDLISSKITDYKPNTSKNENQITHI